MGQDDKLAGTWVKEESTKLIQDVDKLAIEAPVTCPQVPLERVEKDQSTRSPAARVFNTYELAEMILDKLPLEDLIKAQRICHMTRAVVLRSANVCQGHSVYLSEWKPFRPFQRFIDFAHPSAPDSNHYRYAHRSASSLFDKSLVIRFHLLTFWAILSTADKERQNDSHIVTIKPLPPSGSTKSDVHYASSASELWRSVRWMQNNDAVCIEFEIGCDMGHQMYREMVFPSGATLGETFDWMYGMCHSPVVCPTPDLWSDCNLKH